METLLQTGVPGIITSRLRAFLLRERRLASRILSRYREKDSRDLIKELCLANAVLSGAMSAAERSLGLSAVFIAPEDRIHVGGAGLACQNLTGDTAIDLDIQEAEYRKLTSVEQSP